MGVGERRLAAIMFTDISGYTRLSQSDEPLALELLGEHRGILRSSFATHGGVEVKTTGDGFLVEFRSALDAVNCAVEIQRAMEGRNERADATRRLELRIGIHVGDVVHEGGDIYGDAVNVASRIEPLAEPGGICISQQTYDQVRNKVPLSFQEIRDVRLKNIDLPQAVYKVNLRDSAQALSGSDSPSRKDRLCVLPFVNISPDPSDEYFADGLTEELIDRISGIGGLKVIARTSAMSYKRKEKKVSEIGRELGVGWVIEGSVRKATGRVRVMVQLIDAVSEERIWSSNYDSQLDDIFAIQSDVASRVASSLSAKLFRPPHQDTEDIEAYTLYLRAVHLSYDLSESSIRETISLLQRAVEKDPGFARAHAALADEFGALAVSGYSDFVENAKKSEEEAVKALRLDPGLAEAHSAMSSVHSMMDNFDAARREAETAVRINPNLSEAYLALGILYSTLPDGQEKSLQVFRKAYELDPLFIGASEILATSLMNAGDFEAARGVLDRMKELSPRFSRVYLVIADYHMARREFDQAQTMIDTARRLEPENPSIEISQGLVYALSGDLKAAELQLKKIQTLQTESMRLHGEVLLFAAMGRQDDVFRVLMSMAETHSWPFDIRLDPLFAATRRDPRFREFCRKVGMPS